MHYSGMQQPGRIMSNSKFFIVARIVIMEDAWRLAEPIAGHAFRDATIMGFYEVKPCPMKMAGSAMARVWRVSA